MKYQGINITTANTFVIAKDQSLLGKITINKADAHTIAFYDGQAAATGKLLGTLKASAAEGTYHYDIECQNGITIVTAASFAGDITISFV